MKQTCLVLIVTSILSQGVLPASAQPAHIGLHPPAANVIMPQSRITSFARDRTRAIRITEVEALINIVENTATTTLEIRLENQTSHRQEAELLFPVPDGAVIKGFAYDGPNGESITAQVLEREQARQIYRNLVSRIKDPALVEFVGFNLIQSSVFPVEPRGKQRVRLTYEHLLVREGNRIDYVLPRSESLQYKVPWKITAHATSKVPICTVYSPTHKVYTHREDNNTVSIKMDHKALTAPGPLRVSILLESDAMAASFFAYPNAKANGGYFLLLAGLPDLDAAEIQSIQREVTLVIDRSGSMRNEKMDQVKEAALQVIAGLKEGEAFNIILYSNSVETFSQAPVIKNHETAAAARQYIESIHVAGGTNIHDALSRALAQKPTRGMLPLVLFLTDGLPTVGQTSETAIRNLVVSNNPHERRVFTFGVGLDVNAHLLEKIADLSRAKPAFVLPHEDVEATIGRVFDQLSGPVLTDTRLTVQTTTGAPALGRTQDLLPAVLPDLYKGDQWVLLGQYLGKRPLHFVVSGQCRGKAQEFVFKFNPKTATPKNGFVSRLWASRKIAELVDLIRQLGSETSVTSQDPRVKELTDDIIRLSTEFGILTEYTAFLAREGTDLTDRAHIFNEAGRRLEDRAMRLRSQAPGVVQSLNNTAMKTQTELNYSNAWLNDAMQTEHTIAIQQINDLAFYNRAGRWIDSRLTQDAAHQKPDEIIEFGSPAYMTLAETLARQGRQASLAFDTDVLLWIDGKRILVRMPNPMH